MEKDEGIASRQEKQHSNKLLIPHLSNNFKILQVLFLDRYNFKVRTTSQMHMQPNHLLANIIAQLKYNFDILQVIFYIEELQIITVINNNEMKLIVIDYITNKSPRKSTLK